MSLRMEVAGKSDVGCLRSNNEDNLGYDTRHGIFVVCDGMGGMAAGEVAAKMAVDTVLDYFRSHQEDGYQAYGIQQEGVSRRANTLGSAVQYANAVVFQAAGHYAAQTGMGATIVALYADDEGYSIAHVGDSRIYLIRDNSIEQLTDDHSLVMEQVRRGLITVEQARRSHVQNIIIRALGSENGVKVDLADRVALPGDLLLLCTDGLTRHLEDSEIREIVSGDQDVEKACDHLVELAKQRGGEDNITVLLVHFADQTVLGKLFGGGSKWQDSL